ncbi:MAG: hypothetical protein RLN99_08280 [Kiloniellaceae bacterium]
MPKAANNSEVTVMASLVTWFQDNPAWQRDALRRLCTTVVLDDAETTALLAICEGEATGEPLTSDHVRSAYAGKSVVTFKQLHGVEHTNVFSIGDRLGFGFRPDRCLWRQRFGQIGVYLRLQEGMPHPYQAHRGVDAPSSAGPRAGWGQ